MDNVYLKQLFDYDTWTYTYIIWTKDNCDAIIIMFCNYLYTIILEIIFNLRKKIIIQKLSKSLLL